MPNTDTSNVPALINAVLASEVVISAGGQPRILKGEGILKEISALHPVTTITGVAVVNIHEGLLPELIAFARDNPTPSQRQALALMLAELHDLQNEGQNDEDEA
jgi:hypothetical protein